MRTIDEPPRGPGTIDDLVDDLAHAIGAIRCAGSQRLLRLGVSMTHLHVLTLLRHHGPLPMSRIAEFLDGSLSGATGVVDRMEARGLVARVRVPEDRRVVAVQPTGAGDSLVDEVEIVRSELARSVLARLDGVQLGRLSDAIADVRAAVAAELAAAPDGSLARCSHPDAAGEAGRRIPTSPGAPRA